MKVKLGGTLLQPVLYRAKANMIPESTPINEALKECTAEEKAAIQGRTPPYDGVWTWGDLLVVRERLAAAPKVMKQDKAAS